MMKKALLLLVWICLPLALTGCGGDDSVSHPDPAVDPAPAPEPTPPPEPDPVPSATAYPFGVETMTIPIHRGILSYQFNYDDEARLVEVIGTQEVDLEDDGRVDGIVTMAVTLDPALPEVNVPEMGTDMRRSVGSPVQTLGSARSSLLPPFADRLEGAIVKIDVSEYLYGGGYKSIAIPEELLLTSQVTATYAYDDAGRLVQAQAVNDSDYGRNEMMVTFTYDAAGNVVKSKTVNRRDEDRNGWDEQSEAAEERCTYDESGRLIEKVADDYSSSTLGTTTYAYDDAGNLVEEDYRRTPRGQENPLTQVVTSYAYDTAGNLVDEVRSEYRFETPEIRNLTYLTTLAYSYDESGRILETVQERDNDDDPATPGAVDTHTYTYGDFGVTSYLHDSRAVEYDLYSLSTHEFTYDDQGRITEIRFPSDHDLDGVADSYEITAMAYDAEGRLISRAYSRNLADVNGEPGEATFKEVTTWAYDEEGRLTGWDFDSIISGYINRKSVQLAYGEEENSAAGTLTPYFWDAAANEGAGGFVTSGEARPVSFTFLAGAPKSTMESPLLELYIREDARDFERIRLTVPQPALYVLSEEPLSLER